jgi:hypothetical protein
MVSMVFFCLVELNLIFDCYGSQSPAFAHSGILSGIIRYCQLFSDILGFYQAFPDQRLLVIPRYWYCWDLPGIAKYYQVFLGVFGFYQAFPDSIRNCQLLPHIVIIGIYRALPALLRIIRQVSSGIIGFVGFYYQLLPCIIGAGICHTLSGIT